MSNILDVRLKHAYKTEVEWSNLQTIPLEGELCISSDKSNFKIGDGVHNWTSLHYILDSNNLESAYQKTYDLVDSFDSSIQGDVVHDPIEHAMKFNGTMTLLVPRKSDYAVHLEIQFWTEGGNGYISTPVISYSLAQEVDMVFHQSTELEITCDSTVWITRIQILEINANIIPTKVSQLENDLGYVTALVSDEILEINKP